MRYIFIVFITHFNKLNKEKYMHKSLTIIEDLSNFNLVKYEQD